MHRVWTDSEIRRFLWDNEVISRAQAEATLRASLDSFAPERFGVWAIKIKGSHKIVGFCGLRRTEDADEIEILYGILPDSTRRGLASEAGAAVLSHGLREIGLESIIARADEPNRA